jgi:hypothetical protein
MLKNKCSVRELNLFHSDITVIILHCKKCISYNWRPYLSIIPHVYIYVCVCVCEYIYIYIYAIVQV